jgi:HlyD family secretion protein
MRGLGCIVFEWIVMVDRACCRQLCALLACAVAALCAAGCRKSGDGGVRNGANPVDRHIVALGRLEPAGGVLAISAIPGDVLKNFGPGVEEGAIVEAGSVLALVNSYNLRATQLEAATTKLELGKRQRAQEIAVAEANQQQALASQAEVRAKLEEIEAQGDALGSLAEAARIAQTDYEKLVELRATDPELVTELQLRRKRNQADQAGREYDVRQRSHDAALTAARAAVVAAEKSVSLADLNLKLAQDVDRNAIAEIEKKVAEQTLEQSILRAPKTENGPTQFKVLKILLEPGEFVTQFPVLQIADVTQMVCIAEVYEADAKEIKPGQAAVIHSSALSDGFEIVPAADGTVSGGIAGKVVRVGSLVSSGGLIQRNPLAPSDRSIIEVLIAIDPKDAKATAEAASHIGMQVTVYFGKQPAGGAAKAPRPAQAGGAAAPKGDELKSP